MNISHKNKHISIFAIYNSPKNTYTNLINHLLPKIDNEYLINKKVLLRECKRHTACRVAIAISCYSRRGGPLTKNFFPVWTCIKPNLVSKIFPFTETRYTSPPKNLRHGIHPEKIWDLGPPLKNLRQHGTPQKSETWDPLPLPLPHPPKKNLRPGIPPKVWTKCENITSHHPSHAGDNKHIVILSDFNIEQHTNDYLKLSSKLAKYNIKQYIHNYTTINNTTIDYVFTNMQINKINILYGRWSDHNIIQLQIDT